MTTIRQAIVPDREVANLIEQIHDLPKLIEFQRVGLSDLEFKLAIFIDDKSAEEDVKALEGEALFVIQNEMVDVPNGKTGELKPVKKYSNDDQRKVALRRQLWGDASHSKALARVLNAKTAKAQLVLDIAQKTAAVNALAAQLAGANTIGHMVAGLANESTTGFKLDQLVKYRNMADKVENALSELDAEAEVSNQ